MTDDTQQEKTVRYCHQCESVFHASPEMHGQRYHVEGKVWKFEEFDDDPRE